jgi:uncharacterized FlaG/YvyC family protein
MAQEIQLREFPASAVDRQRPVTSDSQNDSTRKPIVSRERGTDKTELSSSSVPEPIDVQRAIETLNKIAEAQQKDVSFSVDKESESTVIKVVRTKTGELIKQFPPEEILAMRARIRNQTSWFFDSKA